MCLGEFHALGAHQAFAARMLEELCQRRGTAVLGVEFVYTRQQHWLDRRQRGLLDDAAFRWRIHYAEEWGDPWEGYRMLLDTARRLGVPVYGLDVAPRAGFRHLARRDEHAARRIVASLVSHPHAVHLVLFGESHLSPGHIPRRVGREAQRRALGPLPMVLVYQDPEPAYWAWLARGEALPEALELGGGRFAVFHTSPLGKYEAYRQMLERWRDEVRADEELDLTTAVHHAIDTLAAHWLGLRPTRVRLAHAGGWSEELADAYPEVYSGSDAEIQLPGVLSEHGRSAEEIEDARQVLAARGALYDKRSNTLFLRRYVPAAAGAEAARFLRTALSGRLWQEPEERWNDPWARLLGAAYDEAVAILGARLVDPTDLWPPGENLAATRVEAVAWVRRVVSRRTDALTGERSAQRRWVRMAGRAMGESWFKQARLGGLRAPGLRRIFRRPLQEERVFQVWRELLRVL